MTQPPSPWGGALGDDHLVTIALHPPRGGVLSLVPGGSVADEVVFFDEGRLKCTAIAERARPVLNTGAMPLADIAVDSAAVELRRAAQPKGCSRPRGTNGWC